MHTEHVTKQQDKKTLLKNDADALLGINEPVTYKSAKVIYLAAHRSKQMIREEVELQNTEARLKTMQQGRSFFGWLRKCSNWLGNIFYTFQKG
jgi:hypothetical protein